MERYSPETFESIPEKMEALITDGRLLASRSVKDEIKDDPNATELTLAKWCRGQNGFYAEDNSDVQNVAIDLLDKYQNPLKKRGISGADPFVIARARVQGNDWCVVSAENPANGNAHKDPNIPFVCQGEGIEHIDFYTLMKREGWRLR